MEARRQALEGLDSEDADNVDEGIEVLEEELELDRKRAQTTEWPTEVQHMIAAEMEKWTPHSNTPMLTVLVKKPIIEALQVGYHAAKEVGKTRLFMF